MSAQIIRGLIISAENFQENDLIVKILTNYKIYSVIAIGVRKPQSKNRASLIIGTFGEYEIFVARLKNKISKLKKGNVIKTLNFSNQSINNSFKTFFHFLNKIENSNSELFKSIEFLWESINPENASYIRTFLMSKILISLGYKPFYHCCFICKSNRNLRNFQFYNGGMTCAQHTKLKEGRTLEELKSFYYLGLNFLEYYKNTIPLLNLNIYKEIKYYISENIL